MPEVLVGGSSLRTPMRLDDFLALGETKHAEYYDGVCVMNPPTRQHERTVAVLRAEIEAACPAGYEVLTGWGWMTSSGRRFEPDIMVCDTDSPDDDILRTPAPLLVVEVSSPSTRSDDWGIKLSEYGHSGAGWYWLVDLEQREIVIMENVGDRFVERARSRGRLTPPGPVPAAIDAALLPRR